MNVRIRKRVFRQLLGMVTILGGMFLLSLPAQAITYWQVGTGDWSTGANWDNGEPTSDDYAYINNGGTAQITLNDRVCRFLNLGRNAGESGTVEMSSGSLSARKYETIGYEGTGIFTQSGGTYG
ncbi:MAG: hypothetical protein GXO98_03145 [Nitrospirae bacterium]|nr:hypothetical protein [Nitrospirota bacterium]